MDVSGEEIKLSNFKGKKNVALIFYADHNWLPCIEQLGGLQNKISEIEKLNAEVIAISTAGNKQDVELTKKSLGITYTLIPTPNRKVGEDFGLTYSAGAAYATFVIDKKSRIRYRSAETWNRRTSVSQIIKELQGI
jgi:peroxiredoxin